MKKNKGSAILMTIGITAVLLVLAGAFLGLARSEVIISSRQADYLKSQYLAEAGMLLAKSEMSRGIDWSSGVSRNLELHSGSFEGEAEVTLTLPPTVGYLEIKSTGRVPGRSERTVKSKVTPPAKYVLYAENLIIDRPGAGQDVQDSLGIALDSAAEYSGTISFSGTVEAAYQQIYDVNGVVTEPSHVHCFKPAELDVNYMQKLNQYRSILDLGEFSYEYLDGDQVLSGIQHNKIVFVKGNARLVSSDSEPLEFDNCFIIAGGDIVLINIAEVPSCYNGMLFAGQGIKVMQMKGLFNINGALAAGKDIEIDAFNGEVRLNGVAEYINALPYAFKETLGFLMPAN
ncbi:MAG: hypothetical protein ACM3PP_08085 [Candidatus Saccharibacteria bacterium]